MTDVANFAGACGECGNQGSYFKASCPGGMQINQSATVNGSSPLNCVVANDGGAVFEIILQPIAGIYDYQIRVYAQGPSGAFSGSMYLAFQDMTGDVYYLSIDSATREWHEVPYNSDSAAIKTIFWSDYGFTVGEGVDANRPKPRYKVQSLVEAAN